MKIIQQLIHNKKWAALLSGVLAVTVFFCALSLRSLWPKPGENDSGSSAAQSETVKSEPADTGGSEGHSSEPGSVVSSVEPTPKPTGSSQSSSSKVQGTVSNPVTVTSINQAKKLPKFKSYQEILALLKTMGITYEGYYRGLVGDVSGPAESQNDALSPNADNTAKGNDYSSTNTQVSGIDEGDIIKNDGEYLYIANQGTVSIVKVFPAEAMNKAAEITLPQNEYVQEIYLKENLLTLVCNSYEQIKIEPVITPEPTGAAVTGTESSRETVSGEKPETEPGVAYEPAIWYMGRQLTVIRVYDITDRTAPSLKRTLQFDGYLTASRVKDGKFYLVTNQYIYNFPESQVKAEDILPSYRDSAAGSAEIVIPAEKIEYCPENVSANFILISCFDIDTAEPAVVETVLGAGNTIYMSNNAMYIVQPFYRYYTTTVPKAESGDIKPADGTAGEAGNTGETGSAAEPSALPPDSRVESGSSGTASSAVEPEPVITVADEGTVIMKFVLTETGVKFSVAGEVRGQILNQYSMDEYNNTFRIATTQWTVNGTTNNLYVLDSAMKVTGRIENLAPGERIYSVRFTGKTGYIVTFRNMDPLFVIDLSNPAAPKVAGELIIPGFSNYLHPVSDTLLLGIGQNTETIYKQDEYGNYVEVGSQQSGLKVSLFDVSDPTAPKEVSSLKFGGAGSNTEAQYNPKAFVWWSTRATALFPAFLCGEDGSTSYSDYYNSKSGAIAVAVVGGKLVEKARLFPENTNYGYYGQSRTAYIDNVIYLSMNGKVYAFDAETRAEIGRVTFGDPVAYKQYMVD